MIGAKSRVDVAYSIERLDEQRAADEEHRGQRELSAYQEPEGPSTARRTRTAVGGRMNRGPHIAGYRVQGRCPSKKNHRRDDNRE